MRITKTVGEYLLGSGAVDHFEKMLSKDGERLTGRVVYLFDHCFSDGKLAARFPIKVSDSIVYLDTTDEPTTDGVDTLVRDLRSGDAVVAVVGIGGGATLDSAKAVSNLLTNDGKAADYQG